jgi:anti-anti-sigma regulatory factor
LSVTHRREGSALVIQAPEPVGDDTAGALKRLLLEELPRQSSDVVVDLLDARVIDGACLATLLAAAATLPSTARLTVVARPSILEALREWRLDEGIILSAGSDPVPDRKRKGAADRAVE